MLALAAPAAAQWVEPTGPAGLAARALVAHGPDDVVAGTLAGSAFAFDGATWTHQPGVRLPTSRLYRHGAFLFEVRDDSLFASPDGGVMWNYTGQRGGGGSNLNVFVGEDGFYAQTGVAVGRTTDGGGTWTPAVDDLNVTVTIGSTTISGPLTVAAFGLSGGALVAEGHVDGVVGLFRTDDAGATWERLSASLSASGFRVWNGALYSFSCASRRSTDHGLTWTSLSVPHTGGLPACFDLVVPTEGHLLGLDIGSDGRAGVYRLDGSVWTHAIAAPVLALDGAGGAAFAATEDGVLRSVDSGQTWAPLPLPIVLTATPYVASTSTAIALVEGGRISRSTDGGQTWGPLGALQPIGLRAALLFDRGGALLAATEDGVFRSTDEGQTWSPSNGGIQYPAILINRAPSDFSGTASVVYAAFATGQQQDHLPGISFGGVYRSTDGGQTWAAAFDGLPTTAGGDPVGVRLLAAVGDAVFARTNSGPYASPDRGQTWAPAAGLPGGSPVLRVDASGTGLYAVTNNGLFESLDGGQTWHAAGAGLPAGAAFFRDVRLVTLDGRLFAVGPDGDTNRAWEFDGTSWTAFELVVPAGVRFTRLTAQGLWVLAGSVDGGVWRVPAVAFTDLPTGTGDPRHPAFALSDPSPNPAREAVRLTLSVGEAQAHMRVEVIDALGRRVALLHDAPTEAGVHALVLDASVLPGGAYLVRAAGPRMTAVKRLVVVR